MAEDSRKFLHKGSPFFRISSFLNKSRAKGDFSQAELRQGVMKKVDKHGRWRGIIPENWPLGTEHWVEFKTKPPIPIQVAFLSGSILTMLGIFVVFHKWLGPYLYNSRQFISLMEYKKLQEEKKL